MSEDINDEVEIPTYDTLEDFIPLIEELDENYTLQDIKNILIKIPDNNPVIRHHIFERIMEKTKLRKGELKEILKSTENETRRYRAGLIEKWQQTLQTENEDYEYIIYDNNIIELKSRYISLLTNWNPGTGFYNRISIAGFGLKLIFKTLDKKRKNVEIFTFYSNKELFYNYEINDFMNLRQDKLFKDNLSKNVIKYIFDKKSKNLPIRKAKYIPGWKNGWKLPINDDKNNFSLICYTAYQRDIVDKIKKMYKKHSPEYKEKIYKLITRFIGITKFDPIYLSIVIGFSMIAPFKLYFIKNYKLFPHLILEGDRNTAKTAILDTFIVDWFGIDKEHIAGKVFESVARFENFVTGSTFPLFVDEYVIKDKNSINLLKEMATAMSDYI
ncbi:hypothetical protein LCGC14_2425760, partial [marine sediment metagenome]